MRPSNACHGLSQLRSDWIGMPGLLGQMQRLGFRCSSKYSVNRSEDGYNVGKKCVVSNYPGARRLQEPFPLDARSPWLDAASGAVCSARPVASLYLAMDIRERFSMQ